MASILKSFIIQMHQKIWIIHIPPKKTIIIKRKRLIVVSKDVLKSLK